MLSLLGKFSEWAPMLFVQSVIGSLTMAASMSHGTIRLNRNIFNKLRLLNTEQISHLYIIFRLIFRFDFCSFFSLLRFYGTYHLNF